MQMAWTTYTTKVNSPDVFDEIIPDNISLTDFLKSPQSILLAKDQAPRSGMVSPFHYRNFWKPKDDSPLRNQRNNNDEFTDMYQFNNQDDHKLTNMFVSNNRNFEQQELNVLSTSGFKKVSESNSPIIPKDIVYNNGSTYRQRAMSDDIIVDDDDDDDDITSQKGNGRRKFNKGLKLLSVIVKDIVVEKQLTTYKEVADIILKDTIKFESLNLNTKLEISKEEQNIKRRVYDALNVLIAAGVLIKEGKYVRKNTNNDKIIVNLKRLDANTYASKIVT